MKEQAMYQRKVLALLVLVLAGPAWAQGVPERILPRGSQLYLRWDGVELHRKTFDNSAVGKMLQGDTGKFLSGIGDYFEKVVENFVAPESPQAADMLRELPKACNAIVKNGFRLGIEVRSLTPPDVEGMFVFPRAGKEDSGILAFLGKAAKMAGAEIQDQKKAGRSVRVVDLQVAKLGWWTEGADAVVVLGTHSPDSTFQKSKKDFTTNALYRDLKSFEEFPTWADGFLDMASLLKVAAAVSPDVSRLIDDLGLKGLKSITFHSGFEGPAERSVVLIDMPGPRKGLLKLANQRKISLADLPPMPADLTSFSASNLDLPALYDGVVLGIVGVARIFAPDQANMVKEGIKVVEDAIGVKIREELFGTLGDLVVSYSSPSEGPLGFGSVYLIKVKDAKKLTGSLDNLFKVAATVPLVDINLKKQAYHGADINGLYLGFGGSSFHVLNYTIYKDWLAISFYPQPLQGFALRLNEELPVWKLPASLEKRLAAFPKEFVGISVSDPRPGLKLILSIAPPLVDLLNSAVSGFAPGAQFDINLIPNALEATRHLFPNITVTTDDGKRIRMETRASLALPF